MSDTATTSETSTTTTTEIPNPQRTSKEPAMLPADKLFNQLSSFTWPKAIDQTWCDLAHAVAKDADEAIERAFNKIGDDAAAAYQKTLDAFDSEWGEMLLKMPEKAREVAVKDVQRKADEASRAAQAKSEALQADAIKLMEAKIDEHYNAARNLLAIFPNAAALLTGTTVGPEFDADVERYSRRMAHADFVVMRTFAARALTTGNRALQAAVCERLSSMDKSPISPRDFAYRVIGQQHDRLVLVEKELRSIKTNLASRRSEAFQRKDNLLRKIKSGLSKYQAGKLQTNIEDQDGE